MAALLSQLREQRRKDEPDPYLDMVFTAFCCKASTCQQKQEKSR